MDEDDSFLNPAGNLFHEVRVAILNGQWQFDAVDYEAFIWNYGVNWKLEDTHMPTWSHL